MDVNLIKMNIGGNNSYVISNLEGVEVEVGSEAGHALTDRDFGCAHEKPGEQRVAV